MSIVIEDKFSLLLGKQVYNKNLDKYGYISEITIRNLLTGNSIGLNVFYDAFDSSTLTFFDDFKDGKVQFVIISDIPYPHDYVAKMTSDIMETMGKDFTNNMLIYMTSEDWSTNLKEQESRNFQQLHTDLVNLDALNVETIANDFYARELYLKYKDGVLTETQMLYAMANRLAQKLKRVNDKNLDYFVKYEFGKSLESKCEI